MMSLNREAPERQDIEALLPWHAAGTLSRRDSDRVEQALASDRELARRYELVREELNETIHLNETLGAPSLATAMATTPGWFGPSISRVDTPRGSMPEWASLLAEVCDEGGIVLQDQGLVCGGEQRRDALRDRARARA